MGDFTHYPDVAAVLFCRVRMSIFPHVLKVAVSISPPSMCNYARYDASILQNHRGGSEEVGGMRRYPIPQIRRSLFSFKKVMGPNCILYSRMCNCVLASVFGRELFAMVPPAHPFADAKILALRRCVTCWFLITECLIPPSL